MKKYKYKVVFILSVVTLLSGCTALEKWISDKGLDDSGIKDLPEYMQYQNYQDEYDLDDEGYVVFEAAEDAVPAMAEVSEGIHITAAENNRLNVRYYCDKSLNDQIDIDNYYVNRNDTIYVSAANSDESNKLYEFSEIRVFDITPDGKRTELKDVWDSENNLFHIPADYIGSELAIEPLGRYLPCSANLEAYYVDGEERHTINCSWEIDGSIYNRTTAELDSAHTHNIIMKFDGDIYYHDPNDPDESVGFESEKILSGNTAEFQNVSLTEKECRFLVMLHKYMKCKIFSEKDECKAIRVNDEKEYTSSEIPKLKAGDKIVIDLNDGYKAECIQFKYQSEEPISVGTRYTFIVPEVSDDIQIYTLKNSDKIYEYIGIPFEHAQMTAQVVSTGYALKSNENIPGSTEVRITIKPDQGYVLKNGIFNSNVDKETNTYSKEMKYSDYLKIRNQLIKDITITEE